jgi:hypothetical protein
VISPPHDFVPVGHKQRPHHTCRIKEPTGLKRLRQRVQCGARTNPRWKQDNQRP